MMSTLIEEALGGELDAHLGYEPYNQNSKEIDNSRNGYSKKTMHTSYADMDANIPRDRIINRIGKYGKFQGKMER